MNTIIKSLQQNKKYAEVLNDINNKKGPILLSGLTDVAKSQIISRIGEDTKRNILVITYNELQAKKILEDLKYFTQNAYFFKKKEIVTYDYVVESFDNLYERIKVLNELNTNKKTIIVTTIEAAMQKMIPKNILYKNKKIGGILTETKVVSENVKYLVIGIGINTKKQHFSKDIENIATSIKKEFNIDINTEEFISEFCNRFEKQLYERIEY